MAITFFFFPSVGEDDEGHAGDDQAETHGLIQEHHADACEKDPVGAHVKDGGERLPFAAEHVEFHSHTADDVDETHGQRNNEERDGIDQGVEGDGFSAHGNGDPVEEGRGGLGRGGGLIAHKGSHNSIRQVAEPPAEDRAQDGTGDAAVSEHGHRPFHAGRDALHEFRTQESAQSEQETVAHVGEHEAEDHKVVDTHDEGRVIGPVLGVRIHPHHPLEVGGKAVVFQQNGDVVLRGGIGHFIGTGQSVQGGGHTGFGGGRDPGLQHRTLLGGGQLLLLTCCREGGHLQVVEHLYVGDPVG